MREKYIYEIGAAGVRNYAEGFPLLHSFGYYTLNNTPEGTGLSLPPRPKTTANTAPMNHHEHGSPALISPDARAGNAVATEAALTTAKGGKVPLVGKRINKKPAGWDKVDVSITLGTIPGLKYDRTDMTVKAGSRLKWTFVNKDDMLHNLVIVKPGKATAIGDQALQLGLKRRAHGVCTRFGPGTLPHRPGTAWRYGNDLFVRSGPAGDLRICLYISRSCTDHAGGIAGGKVSMLLVVSKSIAVMPFKNLSSDPENEYFSDGMTEEIINALSQIDGLKVTARTSSFAFKDARQDIRQIGKELGVSLVLEGSVRKSSERLRINAKLVRTEDGFQIWSRNFDRMMTDVFELQDEISLLLADKIREHLGHLSIQDHLVQINTDNVKAYQCYLKGRYCYNKWDMPGFAEAAREFEKSILEDPTFDLPYFGIGLSYSFLGSWGRHGKRIGFCPCGRLLCPG